MTNHLDSEDLIEFVRGAVSTDCHDEVTRHVEGCAECRRRLTVIRFLRSEMPQRAIAGVWRRPARIAAGIAVAVLLGATAATFYWPTSGATAVNPTADAPLDPASLATTESLDSIYLIPRFGRTTAVSTNDELELKAAVTDLVERRFEEALEVLERLHEQQPQSPEIGMYVGICRYLLGDDSEDIGKLLAAATESGLEPTRDAAQWFLANHLLRNGRVREAKAVLTVLATEVGRPARDAEELLRKLSE